AGSPERHRTSGAAGGSPDEEPDRRSGGSGPPEPPGASPYPARRANSRRATGTTARRRTAEEVDRGRDDPLAGRGAVSSSVGPGRGAGPGPSGPGTTSTRQDRWQPRSSLRPPRVALERRAVAGQGLLAGSGARFARICRRVVVESLTIVPDQLARHPG